MESKEINTRQAIRGIMFSVKAIHCIVQTFYNFLGCFLQPPEKIMESTHLEDGNPTFLRNRKYTNHGYDTMFNS